MAHKFPAARMHVLDSEERQRLLPAEAVLDALGLGPGERLADVGCGTGYFSLPAAQRVGPGGRVHAFDLQPELVAHAAQRAAEAGLANLEVRASEENRVPLPGASVDAVLLSAVIHELAEPPAFLAEMRRILAADGRLLVVEWVPAETGMGPPLHERIAPAALQALLREHGYSPGEAIPLGAAHYGMVASA